MKNEYSFRTCLILPLFLRKGKREDTVNEEMVKIFKPDPKEAGTIGQIEVQAAPFLGHFHGENPHSPEISPLSSSPQGSFSGRWPVKQQVIGFALIAFLSLASSYRLL